MFSVHPRVKFAQPLYITFLLETSTIPLVRTDIPNYYVVIIIGTNVSMSSTGMLEKKRMHHDLVAGDVERFLADGGQITQLDARTSQQAECDYHFTSEKKRKYGRKISREYIRAAKKKRMTFKSL